LFFDEADLTDFTAGGGHVAAIMVSPLSKSGYKSIAFYQHQSVLRLTLEGLGVTKLPGDAASAPTMWEFLTKLLSNSHRRAAACGSTVCIQSANPRRREIVDRAMGAYLP
jgi:hypothetical protein